MTGKTIRIYLVDGSPTGILTAEIMNWTGKVTVGPRARLADMAQPRMSKGLVSIYWSAPIRIPLPRTECMSVRATTFLLD